MRDGDGVDFSQPVFTDDQFDFLCRHIFFDKHTYTKTENKGESDHNDQVSEFCGAFQTGFMDKKAGRLQVLEQSLDFEAAFVVTASFVVGNTNFPSIFLFRYFKELEPVCSPVNVYPF